MAEIKWIKLTTDMFDNRKIKHLRRLPEGDSIVLIWVMLLTMAGRCNAGGMIFLTENIPYTPKMLANELDFEESTVVLALNSLQELNMISSVSGHLSIAGWEEYQNVDRLAEIREYNRLAQQKSRAKRKEVKAISGNVNDKSMTSQRCHETDKEKEEEKDIERDTRNNKTASPFDEILSEITSEELKQTYRDYIEMRKTIKAPMTERALRTLINKVNSLETSIDGKCALLETAILNNWKSVYAPKGEANKPQNPRNPKAPTKGDAFMDELQSMYNSIIEGVTHYD